jgi:hypothetical protein
MQKSTLCMRTFFSFSLCLLFLLTGCAAKETGSLQSIPDPYREQFENTALAYRLCIQDNIAKTDDFNTDLFTAAILAETRCQHLSTELQEILQEVAKTDTGREYKYLNEILFKYDMAKNQAIEVAISYLIPYRSNKYKDYDFIYLENEENINAVIKKD